ncbi:MAG: ABC transporter ATP-binding protein [Elusimicrobiota bacterium]
MPILSTKGLQKVFSDTSVTAVDGLTISVEPREIVGLIGPDGSGKTTALRMICGVIPPTSGTVIIDGYDILANPEPVYHIFGYMPQKFSLYTDLTVEENLDFFADMYGVSKKVRTERFKQLYEFSRLEPFKTRLAMNLSGGMQKKLALACNLIHTPKLLVLDEPTTGVDPVSRRELWDMLYKLVAGGTSIVVSTPYMDEAERCHRVGLMHEGKIIRYGTPDEIHGLSNQQVFEIITTDNHHARNVISKTCPDIKFVYIFGDTLHATAGMETDAGKVNTSIVNTLTAEKVGVKSFCVIHPSFEDIFIELLQEKTG